MRENIHIFLKEYSQDVYVYWKMTGNVTENDSNINEKNTFLRYRHLQLSVKVVKNSWPKRKKIEAGYCF